MSMVERVKRDIFDRCLQFGLNGYQINQYLMFVHLSFLAVNRVILPDGRNLLYNTTCSQWIPPRLEDAEVVG